MSRNTSTEFAQYFQDHELAARTPDRRTRGMGSPILTPGSGRTANTNTNTNTNTSGPGTGVGVGVGEGRRPVQMSPRMELMLKQEARKREEQAHLTFQPRINAAHIRKPQPQNQSQPQSQGISAASRENRFDALYSDALKRHLECTWKQGRGGDEPSFKPRLNRSRPSSRQAARPGSRPSSPPHSPGTAPRTPQTARTSGSVSSAGGSITGGHAGERLHSTPKGKLRAAGFEAHQEHTFSPQITRRAQSIDRRESAKRLYAPNSIEQQQQREAAWRLQQIERELENCTFAPTVNKVAAVQREEFAQRMDKFEREKEQRIRDGQRLRKEEEVAEATFQPVFESKSTRAPTSAEKNAGANAVAGAAVERLPFHERLGQPHERAPDVQVAYTFQPTLISRPGGSPSDQSVQGGPVHERLYLEGEARRRETELAMAAAKEERESGFTFSPHVNHRREEGEGEGPVFERLATTTNRQYMQEVLLRVKAELELRDCTFQPQLIADGSLWATEEKGERGVHERLNDVAEARRAEKQRLVQMAEEAAQSHSFAPSIPEASRSMVNLRSASTSEQGSVGGDCIFERLNSTPLSRNSLTEANASFSSSKVLTDKEHDLLYQRLTSTPRGLVRSDYQGEGGGNSESGSSVARRSSQDILAMAARLHGSTTKSKTVGLADQFQHPPPPHPPARRPSATAPRTSCPAPAPAPAPAAAPASAAAPVGTAWTLWTRWMGQRPRPSTPLHAPGTAKLCPPLLLGALRIRKRRRVKKRLRLLRRGRRPLA